VATQRRAERMAKTSFTWFNGYVFALLLLFACGCLLIIIGAEVATPNTPQQILLISIGTSMAPSAVVATLFRIFLFNEVKYELTEPLTMDICNTVAPQIENLLAQYQQEIIVLRELNDAGRIRPYRTRDIALRDFTSAIDAETAEIIVIGSSLKGLIQQQHHNEIAEKLRFKISYGVPVKFLLTHPAVADLRAGQESRRFTAIGREIIDSLKLLQKWEVKAENVRLYKGTPTCFSIKTGRKMLLNPYPYGSVAYDSPCLIVERNDDNRSYFYDAFDNAHFRTWETDSAEPITNYEDTIQRLEERLGYYEDLVKQILI
jgi:hypothetical protein